MHIKVVAGIIGVLVLGCGSKETSETKADRPTATSKVATEVPLTDLTAETSLQAVRTAFNAHKGEARFLTLLSPT